MLPKNTEIIISVKGWRLPNENFGRLPNENFARKIFRGNKEFSNVVSSLGVKQRYYSFYLIRYINISEAKVMFRIIR